MTIGEGPITEGDPRRIRVLLADAQSLFREAVRVIFDEEPDLHVVAEARDGVQAVERATALEPDVAFLNAQLPKRDGIRATSMIKEAHPGCRVIVVSQDADEALLLGAVEARADGFLTMDVPLTDLIESARAVNAGATLVPPSMLGGLLERLLLRRHEQEEVTIRLSRLTRREREVLGLLLHGADNAAIAGQLVISPQTARTHVQNILGKLEVHSRLEAAAFVRKAGGVDEPVLGEMVGSIGSGAAGGSVSG